MGWDLVRIRYQWQRVQRSSGEGELARWSLDVAQPRRPSQPGLLDWWRQYLGARREATAPGVVQYVHHDLLRTARDC